MQVLLVFETVDSHSELGLANMVDVSCLYVSSGLFL